MDDSIPGLRALAAFADAGSFAVAGERLGLSRSAVSKAVTRLEQRLGRRLVERSSRVTRLTDDGLRLAAHARAVLDALNEADDAFAGDGAAVRGLVRIALPPLYGRIRVLPVLRALSAAHPGLQFDIAFSTRASELVAEGVDLAIRIGAIADRTELVARPLGQQPTALYAAPAYLDASGVPADPDALAAHACLFPDAWLTGGSGPQALRLRDVAAQADAALAGWGIAHLPVWLAAPDVDAGRLLRVLPDLDTPVLPIHVLRARGRYLPRRMRVVVDALVGSLGVQGRSSP